MDIDDLDCRILRERMHGALDQYLSGRASTQELAERVGAHRNTVSAHLQKLKAARFFLPEVLHVSASVVDLARTRIVLQGPSPWTDAALMAAILRVEGVKSVNEFGRDWGVTLYAEDEESLAARVELVREIARARVTRTDYVQPPPARPGALAPRELRLLAGLVGSERADFPRLARDLKVSERTARRDLASLARRNVVAMHYEGDGNAANAVLAYVEARGAGAGARASLAEMPGLIQRYTTPAGEHAVVAVASAAAVAPLAQRLRQAEPGVDAHARVWTRRRTSPHYFPWLRRALLRRARTLEAAKR